jgi:HK97 family phage major capsid protein
MDFLAQLKALREQRKAETDKIAAALTGEALDAIELAVRKIDMQIESVEAQKRAAEAGGGAEDPAARSNEGEGNPESRKFNPIASMSSDGKATNTEEEDIFSTIGYRTAFRSYVTKGTPLPQEYRDAIKEKRSAEMTMVGDVAAVIPTNVLNKVIEDLTVEGKILARVTQTSFQGGVEIPISEINPEATWLESEAVVSEEQKAKMKARLKFSYHVLEARISVGLLSDTIALPMFEATLVKNLKKATIRAIETSIVAGTGLGQPLGITKYTLPSSQKIEFNSTNVDNVKGWARVEAAVPEAYEEGEIYIMNKQTWEMHLNSMTDTTGQKIGLGKINEKGQRILNGREVLCSDKFPSYDTASKGAVFGVLVNLEEYCLNSNLAMYYKKYFDEDKNKTVHKSLMIVDGKMPIGTTEDGTLVGAKGLLYLVKGAESAGE